MFVHENNVDVSQIGKEESIAPYPLLVLHEGFQVFNDSLTEVFNPVTLQEVNGATVKTQKIEKKKLT